MDAAAAEVVEVVWGVIGGEELGPALPPLFGVGGEVVDLAALLPADINGTEGAGAEDAGFEAAAEVGEEKDGRGGCMRLGPGGEGGEGRGFGGLEGAGGEEFAIEGGEQEAEGEGESPVGETGGEKGGGEQEGGERELWGDG